MRFVCSLAVAAIAAAVVPRVALSQVCLAQPTLVAGKAAGLVNATFADGGESFTGTARFAGSQLFGDVNVGLTQYDAFDGSSFVVGGALGTQIAPNRASTLRVCPIANVSFGFGPSDIRDTGVDHSHQGFGAGVGIGGIAMRSESVEIIPAGGVQLAWARSKLSGNGDSFSDSETYGVLSGGVGFAFQRLLTITPSLSIPVGLEDADASFGLTFGFRFH
jgi:hypothetical protein